MARLDTQAIRTRVRELLEDGAGALRQVPGERFGGDLPAGLSAEEKARRALNTRKPLRIELAPGPRHRNRLTIAGDYQIKHVDARITVVRGIYVEDQVSDDLHELVHAQIVEDADAIEQALEWPGNLGTTEAGDPTGLKGGVYQGLSGNPTVTSDAGGAQVLEATHVVRFTAVSRPDAS